MWFLKKENGNVTLLVLVMAAVIILGTASMIGFLYRDIGFTKVDEGNLRALNFAEAGIADFQYKVSQNLVLGEELPPSGYSEKVSGAGGEEGAFTVTYEEIREDGTLKGFKVTSAGTDKSSWQRTVRVNFSLGGSSILNIYDYIYSARSMNNGELMASQTSIIGPFFTNGHLNLRGGVAFEKGPVFVKDAILMGGSSSIGIPDGYIDLHLGGSMTTLDGTPIDPLDPGGENVYVDNYYRNCPELPMLVIDDAYLANLEDVLWIEGGLQVRDKDIHLEHNGSYIIYTASDKVLKIGGNIVVQGDIILGSEKGAPNVIVYEGTAKLISTGKITVFYQLVSNPSTLFPQESLLILISMTDAYLDFKKSLGKPEGEFVAIANNEILLDENTVIRGSLIADHLIVDNNSRIYYIEELSDYWPDDMPEATAVIPDRAVMESWQEIRNQ